MSPEWQSWVEHHAAVFALSTEVDARMLAEWCGLFEKAGWTPAELREATDWVALHCPPRFRADHLIVLQERVRRRRIDRGPPQPEGETLGTCTLCRGAGLVPVPNPIQLARDLWGTQAVACGCALGRWFAEHGNHLPLALYEREVPNWRTLVSEHEALQRRHGRALETARSIDAALGAIEKRRRGYEPQSN